MNVLDQVLSTEAEAATTIQAAHDDATMQIAAAQAHKRESLHAAQANAKVANEAALADFAMQVNRTVEDITTRAETEAATIKRKFEDAKSDINGIIAQSF